MSELKGTPGWVACVLDTLQILDTKDGREPGTPGLQEMIQNARAELGALEARAADAVRLRSWNDALRSEVIKLADLLAAEKALRQRGESAP